MNLSAIKFVRGPYTRKASGRKIIHIHTTDGRHRVIPYPKFLVEVVLERELHPDNETVDHIDQNFDNNSWDNLRLIDRVNHSAEDIIRVKLVDTFCVWCGAASTKTPSQIKDKYTRNHAGPFCGRRCSGQYGAAAQNDCLPKPSSAYYCWYKYIDIEPIYYTLDKDSETVADVAMRLKLHLPDEEYILRILPRFKSKTKSKKIKSTRPCAVCGKYTVNRTYCSFRCERKGYWRVERPTKNELEQLVWTKPTTHIAKQFGVSDSAVTKWCRQYGIEKPTRGYWQKRAAGLEPANTRVEA
jgi:hypothetical protein